MPVGDYLNAKKQVKKEIDTLLFRIRDAYNAAEERLIGEDGLVDLASLENPAQRDRFKDEIVSEFRGNAREYFGLNEEDFNRLPDFRQDRLFFAYLGTTEAGIRNVVEGYRENLNFEHFREEIQKQIEERLKELQQYPLTKLSQEDASGVVLYTELGGKVKPEKLELRDLVGILETFERFGTVPPKFLEGKHYTI